MKCCACGYKKAYPKKTSAYFRELYGTPVKYRYTIIHCPRCKESIVGKDHDINIYKAVPVARENAKKRILRWIKKNKSIVGSYFNIERSLGMLRARHSLLSEWEKREVTEAEFALLNIIRAVPMIVPYMDCLWADTMNKRRKKYSMLLIDNY